jgi:hypothetical protein
VCALVNIYTNYLALNQKKIKTSFYLFLLLFFPIILLLFYIFFNFNNFMKGIFVIKGKLTFFDSLRRDIDTIGRLGGH